MENNTPWHGRCLHYKSKYETQAIKHLENTEPLIYVTINAKEKQI